MWHLKLCKGAEAASIHDAWLRVEGYCFACKMEKREGTWVLIDLCKWKDGFKHGRKSWREWYERSEDGLVSTFRRWVYEQAGSGARKAVGLELLGPNGPMELD